MFPIRDANPTNNTPRITIAIIGVCIAVFLLQMSIDIGTGGLAEFFDTWAIVPGQLIQRPFTEFFTLFSAMFLHGGIMHLGGNMLYLWIFGDNIEDKLGMGRFIVFYIACGLVASFTQIIVNPASNVPNIGASGAIAGVLGGYLILFPRARITTIIMYFSRQLPAFIVLGGWFLIQLFQGVGGLSSSEANQGGGVAFFAHVGGFVAGMILIRLFLLTKQDGVREIVEGEQSIREAVEDIIPRRQPSQRPVQDPLEIEDVDFDNF